MDLCSLAHNFCPLSPVCILIASKAFFLRRSLPVFVFFSLPFYESECFATALCSEAPFSWFCVMLLFLHSLMFTLQMSQTVSSEAMDAVFWPCRFWDSFSLWQTALHAVFTVCWLISLCTLQSVCFDWYLSCVQLPCVQCRTPFLLLPALRSRLIADAELYIQVNSWDSWPLFNGCVLCLYHIHTLLLYSSTVNPSGSVRLR